jgi:hypothetical protein
MGHELGQLVATGQSPLYGGELGPWVTLEADEEEADIEFAGLRIDPVGEAVAPSQ